MSSLEPISITFCISDNYAQHLAVAATSILLHTPGRAFRFHVLAKALSEDTRRRFAEMEARWEGRCRFVEHLIDPTRIERLPLNISFITHETYYRFLLAEILPEEHKTLYLDVDILAQDDLSPLWETDVAGFLFAAVPDDERKAQGNLQRLGLKPTSCYVNAGVLLFNLDEIRAFGFGEKCFAVAERLGDKLFLGDQDAINVVAEGRIKRLPKRWNCFKPSWLPKGEHVAIRHFLTYLAKPWCNIWKNKTWPLYLKYLLKSPYRDRTGAFLLGHLKGFFWFRYTMKGYERTFVCGLLIRKRRVGK